MNKTSSLYTKINYNKILPVLLLLIFYCEIFSLAASERLYSVKPAWWDNYRFELKSADSISKTFLETKKTLSSYERKIENWYILGPFDDNKGKPFDIQLPPEKTLKVVKNAVFKGKEGKGYVVWGSCIFYFPKGYNLRIKTFGVNRYGTLEKKKGK